MAVHHWNKFTSLVLFLDEFLFDAAARKQQITTKCKYYKIKYRLISKSLNIIVIRSNFIQYTAEKYTHWSCELIATCREEYSKEFIGERDVGQNSISVLPKLNSS